MFPFPDTEIFHYPIFIKQWKTQKLMEETENSYKQRKMHKTWVII